MFMQPGVKLDFRHFPDGHVVSAAEVEAELDRICHKLAPRDIVLVNTCAAAAYGSPDYHERGCGMGREATLYLTGAVSKLSAPMPGRGMRHSPTRQRGLHVTVIRLLSGKATKLAGKGPITRWKSCKALKAYRQAASR
jgi:hypothetical protein